MKPGEEPKWGAGKGRSTAADVHCGNAQPGASTTADEASSTHIA